jgi:hypothetical protein
MQIVNVKAIAPLRLAKDTSGPRPAWHVVYPDGSINRLAWLRKSDAIGQANIAYPYFQEKK